MTQGFFLHADIDLSVTVSCLQTDVSKPCTNDIDINTGFQKMYCCGMAEDVWRDPSFPCMWILVDNVLCVPTDDLVYSVSSECTIAM